MNHIDPLDQLSIGTIVSVRNKIGTVVESEIVPAIPFGMIARNVIVFTHKLVTKRQKDGNKKTTMELLPKPTKPAAINYTAIILVSR